ncbi:uncharacterized protein LOC119359698 [Triticum dicoccoides]|uniref:uncharacterized protein LOC119359698 n=1 Tax=Triticum dicoccoides TaxID=85692 RepID=UPI000E7B5EAA|nr:uncharacterized protein LOC119359698 [Triticum dicoccoides]
MSASASTGYDDEMLLLIPCPDCGSQLITWIARGGENAGDRHYKCAKKNVGLCEYIRSNRTYRPDLNRHFGVQHNASASPSRQGMQLRNRIRSQQAVGAGTAGLAEAQSEAFQMDNNRPASARFANHPCCCMEMARLAIVLVAANLIATLFGIEMLVLFLGRLAR